jgi:hypothetical protein
MGITIFALTTLDRSAVYRIICEVWRFYGIELWDVAFCSLGDKHISEEAAASVFSVEGFF